jgi:hypothetical protein
MIAPPPVEVTTAVQTVSLVLTDCASACTHLTSGIQAKTRHTKTANFIGEIYPPYSEAMANKIGIKS